MRYLIKMSVFTALSVLAFMMMNLIFDGSLKLTEYEIGAISGVVFWELSALLDKG